MTVLFSLPRAVAIDSGGTPYPGAKANFYLTGTTTRTDTYTTSALSVAHDNPVVADAAGVFAAIYLDPDITYKLVLTQSDDTAIYTVDPISSPTAQLNEANIFSALNTFTLAGTTSDPTQLFSSTRIVQKIVETDAAADNQVWTWDYSAAVLNAFLVNDAISVITPWMTVTRSATTATEIEFNATALDVNAKLESQASATGGAGLRIPHGTAPSSPVDGDMWTTTAGLYVRINGVTVGPLS